jgi:hypothetical protein
MKTIFSFLFSTITLISFCQPNYNQAMSETIQKMGSSAGVEDFQNCANAFERIASVESKEWLPLYYAAHCYIIMNFQEPDNAKKDQLLDKAQVFLDKAFKIEPNESELYALQALLYPARMNIDPMTRGMQYIGLLNQSNEKAIQLNPENPRPYYLKAIIILNMPEGMGGGKATAKPLFETAKTKFDNFKPNTLLSPNWGKENNQAELDKL